MALLDFGAWWLDSKNYSEPYQMVDSSQHYVREGSMEEANYRVPGRGRKRKEETTLNTPLLHISLTHET